MIQRVFRPTAKEKEATEALEDRATTEEEEEEVPSCALSVSPAVFVFSAPLTSTDVTMYGTTTAL